MKKNSNFLNEIVESPLLKDSFVYSKLNHVFWENLSKIKRLGFNNLKEIKKNEILEIEKKILRIKQTNFFHDNFFSELTNTFNNRLLEDKEYNFIASLEPYPNSRSIAGTPMEGYKFCSQIISDFIPKKILDKADSRGCTGYEIKELFIKNLFKDFIFNLRNSETIIVGPKYTNTFEELTRIKTYHVEIHPLLARESRSLIFKSICDLIDKNKSIKSIILCAGALSCWLSFKIYEKYSNLSLKIYDFGIALLICEPKILLNTSWFHIYGKEILTSIENIHPEWFDKKLHFKFKINKFTINKNYTILGNLYSQGIKLPNQEISSTVNQSSSNKAMSFLENKEIDYNRIIEFLKLSKKENRFTNFGPVSKITEKCIHKFLNLSNNKTIIMINSATSGILIVSSYMKKLSKLKKFIWLISAANFFSTNLNYLSNSKIIDCDINGNLTLDIIKKIPLKTWNGLIFTNIYTQNCAWEEVRNFCLKNKKYFFVDNAAGLLDRPRDKLSEIDIEIISCHQTKPWGSGEGGFIIANKNDEKDIRNFINFGTNNFDNNKEFGLNAKISDLSCAAILDRFERFNEWYYLYKLQERRIKFLIKNNNCDLILLKEKTIPRSPKSYIPFISKKNIKQDNLARAIKIVFRKYYQPLKAKKHKFKNAENLYKNILCIPCHKDMKNLTDKEILEDINLVLN